MEAKEAHLLSKQENAAASTTGKCRLPPAQPEAGAAYGVSRPLSLPLLPPLHSDRLHPHGVSPERKAKLQQLQANKLKGLREDSPWVPAAPGVGDSVSMTWEVAYAPPLIDRFGSDCSACATCPTRALGVENLPEVTSC